MLIKEREKGDLKKLTTLAGKERDAEQRDRLRAAALAVEGAETLEIERMLARSRGFVQRWAYAYRDGGIDAIATTPHPGKPARLPADRHDELRARLDAGPRPEDGVCTLRGRDVQRILAEEFGVEYSLQAVYDTLHRLGYSCLKPRPRHERQDPEAQNRFKEEVAPFLSAPSATRSPRTPGSSGSSTWTKPASASRGR
jgi:transposase